MEPDQAAQSGASKQDLKCTLSYTKSFNVCLFVSDTVFLLP